jgi:hypothetical protein
MQASMKKKGLSLDREVIVEILTFLDEGATEKEKKENAELRKGAMSDLKRGRSWRERTKSA